MALTGAMALAEEVLGEGEVEMTARVLLVLRHQEFWGMVRGVVAVGPEGDLAVQLAGVLLQRAGELWGDGGGGESVSSVSNPVAGGVVLAADKFATPAAAVGAVAQAGHVQGTAAVCELLQGQDEVGSGRGDSSSGSSLSDAPTTDAFPVALASNQASANASSSASATSARASSNDSANGSTSDSSHASSGTSDSSHASSSSSGTQQVLTASSSGSQYAAAGSGVNVGSTGPADRKASTALDGDRSGAVEEGAFRPQPAPRECRRCCTEAGQAGKLRVCSGCMRVMYCSKECQREDWKRHGEICRRVQRLEPPPQQLVPIGK